MAVRIRRHHYRGAATAAVTALALAALTASQAPGLRTVADTVSGNHAAKADETSIDGGSADYYTDLPPLDSPVPAATPSPETTATMPVTGSGGIPATVLAAYRRAQSALDSTDAGCHLPWQLLAAIGKVESGHAAGGRVDAKGTTYRPILGPVLDGNGFASISDTDGGRYDGDTAHDRAVGPMQFIPSTWARWGADGNGDGVRDPDNVFDAARAAGAYLCAGGRDLAVKADLDRAVLGYNHSDAYLRTVLSWYAYYRTGVHSLPDPGGAPSAGSTPSAPARPSSPAGPSPSTPASPGHGPTPSPSPSPSGPGSTSPSPSAPAAPAALVPVGEAVASATAGSGFTAPLRVRAEDAQGKPVAGAKVRYTIIGSTDSRFPKDATHVDATTGADGTATAPALTAGKQTGTFTVRAVVVGHEAATTAFTRTVKAAPVPRADTLVRTSDDKPTARTGATFTRPIEIKATYQGKVAAGVPVTASLVTADPGKPGTYTENDKGPYFLPAGGDGKPVRTLTGLKTGADGLLVLPTLHTDDNAGTFTLRLTTADGAVLTVDLTVTAASPAGTSSPSASASPTASGTAATKR